MNNLLKGKSTKAAGNTLAQEGFISSLNTSGALDEGSGFERKFGASETNPEYAARLEAWKNRGKGGGPMGALAAAAPVAAVDQPAPMGMNAPGGTTATSSQPSIGQSGGGGPVDLPVVNALRPGLGSRIPPELYSALAGLKRIY